MRETGAARQRLASEGFSEGGSVPAAVLGAELGAVLGLLADTRGRGPEWQAI